MKYLVIGANGLVGGSVVRHLKDREADWNGTCFGRLSDGLEKLDITNHEEVRKIIEQSNPDAVFHCANLAGGVDFCQNNKNLAAQFHLEATKTIGQNCKRVQARMIFISTDYIFDGKKETYIENDIPNPLNLYGELKLAAEEWLSNHLEEWTIIRTTNIFGWDPLTVTPNFLMNLYISLERGDSVQVPSYLWGNPTYVRDLADGMIELAEKSLNGIFHIVGPDFIDRYSWAAKCCQEMGWNSSLLHKKSHFDQLGTPRPLKSNLCSQKFLSHCQTTLHNVSEGLELFKKDIV